MILMCIKMIQKPFWHPTITSIPARDKKRDTSPLITTECVVLAIKKGKKSFVVLSGFTVQVFNATQDILHRWCGRTLVR